MKKRALAGLLLVLVSVGALAATTFNGKARMRAGYWNKSDGKWNIGIADKSNAHIEFDITQASASKQGKGKTYAEISALAFLGIEPIHAANVDWNWWTDLGLRFKLGFNYARVVFDKDKNMTLQLTGVVPMSRFAQGWEVEENGELIATNSFLGFATAWCSEFSQASTKFEGDPLPVSRFVNDHFRPYGGWMPGLTFTYDAYSVSLGFDYANTRVDYDKVNLYAMLGIENKKFGDAMTLSAQAGYYQHKFGYADAFDAEHNGKLQARDIFFGGKLVYDNSDSLKVTVGGNAVYNLHDNTDLAPAINPTYATEQWNAEASLNASYTGDAFGVGLDAWFLDNYGLVCGDEQPWDYTTSGEADLGFVYRNQLGEWINASEVIDDGDIKKFYDVIHKALSVRLALKALDSNLNIAITGQDLLNQCIIGADVGYKLGTVTPGVAFTYALETGKKYSTDEHKWSLNDADKNSFWEVKPYANFKTDLFSAQVYARVGKESFDGSKIYVAPYVNVDFKNTLIDGLRLRFRWDSVSFGGGDVAAKSGHSNHGGNNNCAGQIFVEARIDF